MFSAFHAFSEMIFKKLVVLLEFLIRGTGNQLEINLSVGVWPSQWTPLYNELATTKRGWTGPDA